MTECPSISRRQFVGASAAAAMVLPAAWAAAEVATPPRPRVWGANYVPTRRMNTYQCWIRFDRELIAREFSYARRINLNALRMWLSYERWLEAPQDVEHALDALLSIAKDQHIKVLLSLFSDCGGIEPTRAALENNSPIDGYETLSPGTAITHAPEKWPTLYPYLDWIMDRYRDDERLLAIEVTNEPNGKTNEMAAALLKYCAARRGKLPLTIGCISQGQNARFLDHGLDVLQSHPNFLKSTDQLEHFLASCLAMEKQHGKPYWASEWQRIRTKLGWDHTFVAGDEWQPKYVTMAPSFHKAGVSGFFWSLMLRPSFLKIHESKRWLNGVFQEDGAVWSLTDARAIANDPSLELPERREWPAWAADVPH